MRLKVACPLFVLSPFCLFVIGEGRFNPTLGYMPGALIIGHEIGHTQFGGYMIDYLGNKLVNHEGKDAPHTNSPKHLNVKNNENLMRAEYGMVDRLGYLTGFLEDGTDSRVFYDLEGKPLKVLPQQYHFDYKLEDFFSPELK